MNSLIKICGLSTPESLAAARDGGATHLGFIFFEKSPRHVTPELAATLVQDAGSCETVAVSVNADDDYLDSIVSTMKPTMLQLHGGESTERLAEVKARYGLPVMKAFAVRDNADIARAKGYEDVADMLLLDAKPPKGSDLPGGNGVSFDWSLLDKLKTAAPVLLSGGIDLGSVAVAIGHAQASDNSVIGLDVSSGVESAPGVKDIAKIEAFLAACCPD